MKTPEINQALENICIDLRRNDWKYEFEIKDASLVFILYSKRFEFPVAIPIPLLATALKASTEETKYTLITLNYDDKEGADTELRKFQVEYPLMRDLEKRFPLVYEKLSSRIGNGKRKN